MIEAQKISRILGIIAVVLILATSASVWALNLKGNSDIGITYQQALQDNKPSVVFFHAPWCGYCKQFKPVFKQLSETYKDKYNFVMVDGDNSANESIARDYAIGVFPTLYIVDPKIDNRILINQTLYGDINSIKKELDRYLRIRAMINK